MDDAEARLYHRMQSLSIDDGCLANEEIASECYKREGKSYMQGGTDDYFLSGEILLYRYRYLLPPNKATLSSFDNVTRINLHLTLVDEF